MLRSATDLFRAGRYIEAMHGFEAMQAAAVRTAQPQLAARALGNIGGCRFALHQYRDALRSFQQAARQAKAAGDTSAAAAFHANIASLYSEMGEFDAAAQWMQDSLARIAGKDRQEQRPKILLQMATLQIGRAHV